MNNAPSHLERWVFVLKRLPYDRTVSADRAVFLAATTLGYHLYFLPRSAILSAGYFGGRISVKEHRLPSTEHRLSPYLWEHLLLNS
jgi:hypothetical protein